MSCLGFFFFSKSIQSCKISQKKASLADKRAELEAQALEAAPTATTERFSLFGFEMGILNFCQPDREKEKHKQWKLTFRKNSKKSMNNKKQKKTLKRTFVFLD